jgi:hypothetical protein
MPPERHPSVEYLFRRCGWKISSIPAIRLSNHCPVW